MTQGVFRLSRNLMYLGMVLILAGIGILMGTLMPWFVIAPFIALLDALFIRVEETMLEATFGEAYREYKKQVRKWI